MTQLDRWTLLGSISPPDLADAALELHWAAQLVASAGQTFVEPRADDSHRSMDWHDERREFVGAGFAGAYPFRVALRPEDLTLQLLDRTDAPLGSLPLAGTTRAEGIEWLSLGLATYMGSMPPAIEQPEYDMPDHPLAGGARFSTDQGVERAALAALYGTAGSVLHDLVASREDASGVLCWPHHFDIATLLTVVPADGEQAARTIGVGLAPMGGGYDSWYWYVNLYPYPAADALPPRTGPGHWHTEGWIGVVLEGSEVVACPAGDREALVRDFIGGAVATCSSIHGV